MCLAEKQQNQFYSLCANRFDGTGPRTQIYHTRGEHANHYIADVYHTRGEHANHYTTDAARFVLADMTKGHVS